MKLIIAGSRSFTSYELLKFEVKKFIIEQNNRPALIISGTARGADKLGERFATEYGIPIDRWPAKWEELGIRAGLIRNEEMAQIATHCIVFWDGKSRGTKNMIDVAIKYNLTVKIVHFENPIHEITKRKNRRVEEILSSIVG